MNSDVYGVQFLFKNKDDFNFVAKNFVSKPGGKFLFNEIIRVPDGLDPAITLKTRMKYWGCSAEPVVDSIDSTALEITFETLGGEPTIILSELSKRCFEPVDMSYYSLTNKMAGIMSGDRGNLLSLYFTPNFGEEQDRN